MEMEYIVRGELEDEIVRVCWAMAGETIGSLVFKIHDPSASNKIKIIVHPTKQGFIISGAGGRRATSGHRVPPTLWMLIVFSTSQQQPL